jgi:antitoxin component YwqK of YwqJK toxin-antitoxin module
MTVIKLIILLTTLSLFSCTTNNTEVIAKWKNGRPKIERVYSDTPNYFIEKNYYENGQLKSEEKFTGSTENWESTAYYKDGKILGKCFYKNGKINGEVIEFHKTGSLMFKGNQIDGNLVGLTTSYYDNGKPKIELYHSDSNLFFVNYWDISGIQQIKNGEGIRKFQSSLLKDKNGNDTTIIVYIVGYYKDSLSNGLWKYYNATDKKLILEREFIDDKLIYEIWK